MPDRQSLQEEVTQTMKEIQQLEEEKQQLNYEKDQRAQQLQLLLQSIKELSSEATSDWYTWWKQWFASNRNCDDTASVVEAMEEESLTKESEVSRMQVS